MATKNNLYPTATHWGQYLVETDKNELIKVNDYTDESDPSAIGQALLDNRNRDCRITKPMIRKSFLDKQNEHTGDLRGKEAFVPVSWDEATDIAAEALTATKIDTATLLSLVVLTVGPALVDFIMPRVKYTVFLIA